jgi:nicotinate-nucleotide--dimethylbenzimidazole phosphoribosyltransferase
MNARTFPQPLVPAAFPQLEAALRQKLAGRAQHMGHLGELEPLAIRLGLIQNSLKPRLNDPQLVVVAGDHGLAVDGIPAPQRLTTHDLAQELLHGHLPLNVLARQSNLPLTVVDAGMAEDLPAQEGLLARKIAHGTRNARMGAAMTLVQAHAAMRAGMELADRLPGNALLCAGVGTGSRESGALVLSRLTDTPVEQLTTLAAHTSPARHKRVHAALRAAQGRHPQAADPMEVLAAFGGHETAVLAGMMLLGGSQRRLLVVDGIPALAALMVASRLAPAVTDYAVFCRSQTHIGLDHALELFRATALLELGMDSTDGTAAALSWGLIRSAAALMSDVREDEDAGETLPQSLRDWQPIHP